MRKQNKAKSRHSADKRILPALILICMLTLAAAASMSGCGTRMEGEAGSAQGTQGGKAEDKNLIIVTGMQELLEAIEPGAKIRLAAGYYNLSACLEALGADDLRDWNLTHPYTQLRECYDGAELWIQDVENLSISGEAGNAILTVTFKVDRTLVDAYNKAHDTSYELVPAEAYEFSKKEVILPRYNEVSSTAQVTLNSEKMPDGEQYLLPITIEQIKGDDAAQTSDEGNVYYILFNKRVLPPAQLLDREGWKVVHCTSEYTPGEGNPKTGWAKDVLDGNPASYWTYNFKASVGPVVYVPLYFVFDMGKEVTVRGVRITARTKAGGVLNNPPGDITIETAKTITGDGMENDADWTYSERFTGTKPDEGIMSHSLHNSVYLGEIQRARYIRFTLHMSWNSGSSVKPTPMTYKGGTFAEFEVWGNLEELDLD